MKHITLHECYDILEVKDTASLESITREEADELYKFIVKNKLDEDNIIWGRKGITFINYVGYIKLPKFSIEILPKIDINSVEPDKCRKALLNMLQKCGLIKVNYSEIGLLNNYHQNLNEILAYLFAKTLQSELVKGAYLEYITREENTNALKGKLLITKHITNIAENKNKAYCGFEELCIDNSLNQIFKQCIMKLIRNVKNSETIKILKHCLGNLVDVTDREINYSEIQSYDFSRLNIRFEPVYILAKMLISGYSSTGSKGEEKSFSILFKMNEVFEKYVAKILYENITNCQVHVQHNKYKLMIKEGKNTGVFQLKPDIVFESNGKQKLLIDTKWKRIDSSSNRHSVKREDLYQMYAYLTRYPDAECVILLYPHNEFINKESGEVLESWYLENMPDKKIRVYSIELSDERKTVQKLMKIIEYNKFY